MTDLGGFHCESWIAKPTAFCVTCGEALWVYQNIHQMEGFRFRATKCSAAWIPKPKRWAAKRAMICGGALCYWRIAVGGSVSAVLIHALRFSFSSGASRSHGSPCKIYPVMFWHISNSRFSFCNSDSESMRHKRLDLRSK